jgi:hypothetical protein
MEETLELRLISELSYTIVLAVKTEVPMVQRVPD